jgi:hypothetical protein
MKRLIFCLLLLGSSALGQDLSNLTGLTDEQLAHVPSSAATILVTPEAAEDRHPIVAKLVTEIPPGSKVFGSGWKCSDGVRTIPAGTTVQYIWADPGEHEISYEGLWLLVEKIMIVVDIDADGKPVKEEIERTIGYGYVDAKATFTVAGDEDDPPVPPPVPLSSLHVQILTDSEAEMGGAEGAKLNEAIQAVKSYLRQLKVSFAELDQGQPGATQYREMLRSRSLNLRPPVLMVTVLASSRTDPLTAPRQDRFRSAVAFSDSDAAIKWLQEQGVQDE